MLNIYVSIVKLNNNLAPNSNGFDSYNNESGYL